jgi:MtN3 and saliva related transmembrane protein
MMIHTCIGLFAAIFTTTSYFPQIKKCWETGESDDLSLHMLFILCTGISLWILYGILGNDVVIILANSVSLLCLVTLLYFKLRPRSLKRTHGSVRAHATDNRGSCSHESYKQQRPTE